MPAEPGESRQRRIVAQTLAGDADIRPTVMQQRFNFLRSALHQLDANVGEQLAEGFNHRGQAVARLSMGGGDG